MTAGRRMRRGGAAARMIASALLAGALAAGCQPMPHPFEPEVKGVNPLLELKEGRGVTVMTVTGVPEDFGTRLGEALAGALRDAEIPAAVDVGNRGSIVVSGSARKTRAGGRAPELEITWDVAEASGAPLGTIVLHERVGSAALEDTSSGPPPGQLAELAKRSLAKLMPMVRDDMPEPAATAIAVGRIDGAPGDGAASLRRAVEFVLRQSDIPVAAADHANAFTLVGSVEMGRPAEGRQKVAIRWVLLRPDGSEIGDVRQENAVPAGSLDRAWGNTALLVAEAAYDGIVALYERAPAILAQ